MKKKILIVILALALGLLACQGTPSQKSQPVYVDTDLDYEAGKPGWGVLASYQDYLVLAEIQGQTLALAKDINQDPDLTYDFDGIIDGVHVMGNGSILVSTSQGRYSEDAQGQVHLSQDGGKTFNKVLDLDQGSAMSFNFASNDQGLVFVSEYGIKDYPINARNIYRSQDYGQTFDLVYSPQPEEGYHNHVIDIDSQDSNIIYQVIGDDNKRLLVSKDRGQTFEEVWWGDYHPLASFQTPDQIIYSLDNVPQAGLARLDKKSLEIQVLFSPPEIHQGTAYDLAQEGDKIFVAFSSYEEINDWDGSLYYSPDGGGTWENVAIFPQYSPEGPAGIYSLVLKDSYLYMKVTLAREGEEDFRGSLKFDISEL